jgi:hypothetical protein
MPALRHSMTGCDGNKHTCTGCNESKNVLEFPKNKETPCGYDPRCKQCRHQTRRARMGAKLEKPRALTDEERLVRRKDTIRRYVEANKDKLRANNRIAKLRANFGISLDQFTWLLEQQAGLCYICEQPETRIDSRTGLLMNLSVDHDHNCCPGNKCCGECIRGLLCSDCNTSLGKLECRPKAMDKLPWLAEYCKRRPLESYDGLR